MNKLFASDKIEINDEFLNALEMMENTQDHIFLTGKAGTGKSTLLKHFCNNTNKNIVVLAPTGVSAINVEGVTIHSFFRFPFNITDKKKDIKYLYDKAEILKNLDAIIIDEISMLRADLMDAIDYSLRLNTGNRSIPFGGVQLIMIGDLYQLPPVVRGDESEYLKDKYGGVYFFNNENLKNIDLKKIKLTKIFRQKNINFIDLLNKFREKKVTLDDLQLINKRVCPYDNQKGPAIILAATNYIVNKINQQCLKQIQNNELDYPAYIEGVFNEKDFPAEKNLKLRVGAQVMMLVNDTNIKKRWVNGTIGIVVLLDTNYIVVNINGIDYEIKKKSWEIFDYKYNRDKKNIEKKVKGVFEQYPLKLAWAVTIHKSQGKTFERAIIDFGQGAFAHGQVYVALSRCISLDEIYLKTPIKFSDVILDKEVESFNKK